MLVIKKVEIPVKQYADLEQFEVVVDVSERGGLVRVVCEPVSHRRGENRVFAMIADLEAHDSDADPEELVLVVCREGDVTAVPDECSRDPRFERFCDDGRWWLVFLFRRPLAPSASEPREAAGILGSPSLPPLESEGGERSPSDDS